METRICKICGRELPKAAFRLTRWGQPAETCNECIKAKLRENKALKAQIGGGNSHDPKFDGKDPVEVIQLMTRAKRWLECRGYKIHLEGEYTKVHKIKF
ncbi:MAG: hypothetical protein K2K82_07720 [Muribaculaceae bacterium]|nr:hypothetical protein [Muribaculaceae bacterium]